MWPTSAAVRPFAGAMLAAVLLAPAARATAPLSPPALDTARAGLDHLYHGRTDEAGRAFEAVRALLPDSPAADFLLGGIEWHRLTTGPQGFSGGGQAERDFFARMDAAIEVGEAAVRRDAEDLSARFFLGGAYGYKARYLALQEKWWDAYRTGRRGVSHLERVVDRDPDFADAYLGLGIYHYYSDVLPGVLRFLGTFVGIHGDRERGLREIRRALLDGDLVGVEARFFLAEIESTFEKDAWRALDYSRSLRDEFPENELFIWMNGRVLDDLYLEEPATAEWRSLRERARGRRLRGFLDYRLARSRLFGGDFSGAAEDLARGLQAGFGSPRMTMWGHLRYGQCLDFLGRHEEALHQYGLAAELDASDSGSERARERLSEGRSDPARVSLAELEETAAILAASRRGDETDLRRVEELVTRPPRGLSRAERTRYFDILRDLAGARLRRGDPAGCRAAIDRALDGWQDPDPDSRAALIALRGRAFAREGRRDEAIAALDEAYRKADAEARARIARDREWIESPAFPGGTGGPGGPAPGADDDGRAEEPLHRFTAADRGELRLELEGDFLAPGERLPFRRHDGGWILEAALPRRDVRYRILTDGETPRMDPAAGRIVLDGDTAWSVRVYPKQTKSAPSE